MMNSRDPKTTATGIVLILIGLVAWLFGVGFVELFKAIGNVDIDAIMKVVLPILTGTGLLAAGDNKVNRR